MPPPRGGVIDPNDLEHAPDECPSCGSLDVILGGACTLRDMPYQVPCEAVSCGECGYRALCACRPQAVRHAERGMRFLGKGRIKPGVTPKRPWLGPENLFNPKKEDCPRLRAARRRRDEGWHQKRLRSSKGDWQTIEDRRMRQRFSPRR